MERVRSVGGCVGEWIDPGLVDWVVEVAGSFMAIEWLPSL
jgi:hypothetical protein